MEDARDAKDALAAAGKVVDDREVLLIVFLILRNFEITPFSHPDQS